MASNLQVEKICGTCGKTKENHYTGGFCYHNTSEQFTENPTNENFCAWFEEKFPKLFAKLKQEWKEEHGH